MKQYTKPTVDVVELSVKENIADLPAVFVEENVTIGGQTGVTLTTYNLAARVTSDGSGSTL